MTTRLQQLSEILAEMADHGQRGPDRSLARSGCRFEFWAGATGTCYVHSVFALHACPPIPKSVFLIVTRDSNGAQTIHHVGQCTHDTDTLNLAYIRQTAAEFGANEVHVHFLASGHRDRAQVAFDLSAAFATGDEPPMLAN